LKIILDCVTNYLATQEKVVEITQLEGTDLVIARAHANPAEYQQNLTSGRAAYQLGHAFAELCSSRDNRSTTVLDLGCGTGFVCETLRSTGHTGEIRGNDVSQRMLEYLSGASGYSKLYHGLSIYMPAKLRQEGWVPGWVVMLSCAYYMPQKDLIALVDGCFRLGCRELTLSLEQILPVYAQGIKSRAGIVLHNHYGNAFWQVLSTHIQVDHVYNGPAWVSPLTGASVAAELVTLRR
jgi:SAM-dependent methyltransferase